MPTAGSARPIRRNETAEIVARLKLPLTPPPGVQQKRAKQGWVVRLSRRVAYVFGEADPQIEYAVRLLRIRPAGKDLYRFLIHVPPWVPDGVYDVAITGPGGEMRQIDVFRLGDPACPAAPSGLARHRRESDLIALENLSDKELCWRFDIVVPSTVPGVSVAFDENLIFPFFVSLATAPDRENPGIRVLSYRITLPPSQTATGVHPHTLQWKQVGAVAGSLDVRRPVALDVRKKPLQWVDLSVATPERWVSLIWDLGDGTGALGESVRHRWLTGDVSSIHVYGFDQFGRVFTREVAIMTPLDAQESKGCTVYPSLRKRRFTMIPFLIN